VNVDRINSILSYAANEDRRTRATQGREIVRLTGMRVDQCADCGAHADLGKKIAHYPTCMPGEAFKWLVYYSEDDGDE
jgi:hypothetical protein